MLVLVRSSTPDASFIEDTRHIGLVRSFSYTPGLVLVRSFSYTPGVSLVRGFSKRPDVNFNQEFL